jgi:gamma-glutamyltranspeptidase / glutathione hydrolase
MPRAGDARTARPFLRILSGLCLILASEQTGAVVQQPVRSTSGMVVSSQRLASEVGVDILRSGGNAVDAAVAVGYALAVTLPCCGNLGGGGFATLHLSDGRDVFLNFREKAPFAASANMYLDAKGEIVPKLSLNGYLAAGVPGSVLGLDTLRVKYGTLSREKVMAPAIKLAEEGFVLSRADADSLAAATEAFAGEANVAAIFLHDGKPWRAGDRLIQKELARTLRTIAESGPDAFYKGRIADEIVAASTAHGGILSRKDFESYAVKESAPLRCGYRGYMLISAPPPSSGGTTLCEILGTIEAYPLAEFGYHSAQAVHVMVEAMRHGFVDRNFFLGDPDFVENPLERLLSSDHAARIRAKIDPGKASSSKDVQPGVPPHEGTETTHYSVVDKAGNAVAVTYTINAAFGAKVIAGDTGFFLNDEMDDFTTKPGAPNLFGLVQGKKNSIAPGKRPLSSMSPTIVIKDGKTALVIGSPGGSRIITIVLEAIVNVVDFGMNIQEAVDAPRIHHQWLPDEIAAEPFALSPDTKKALVEMGYTIKEQKPWGAAEAIAVVREKSASDTASSGTDAMPGGGPEPGLYGGHDDRRPAGAALGY